MFRNPLVKSVGVLLALSVLMANAVPALAASPCGDTVTVRAGDTLSHIAAPYDTTANAIMRANPNLTDPHLIHPGQVIRIR